MPTARSLTPRQTPIVWARTLLERHPIAIALLVGVLARLVILVGYRSGALLTNAVLDPVADQPEYLGLAGNLLSGRGFVYGARGFVHAEDLANPVPYIYRTPGYPLVLAALMWATSGSDCSSWPRWGSCRLASCSFAASSRRPCSWRSRGWPWR